MEMDEFSEDQIWDTITEQAKGKIDYRRFQALFPFNPDNFLSSIIYGFAVNRGKEVIADKISAQVVMTGNSVDRQALTQFIEDSRSLLGNEIMLTIKALQMLDDGTEPESVFTTLLGS